MGDFNQVLYQIDRLSSTSSTLPGSARFSQFLSILGYLNYLPPAPTLPGLTTAMVQTVPSNALTVPLQAVPGPLLAWTPPLLDSPSTDQTTPLSFCTPISLVQFGAVNLSLNISGHSMTTACLLFANLGPPRS